MFSKSHISLLSNRQKITAYVIRAIHYIYFLISQPLVDQKLYLILPIEKVHILGFTYGIIQ